MESNIKKTSFEILRDFLHLHPECAKFLPTFSAQYAEMKKDLIQKILPPDQIASTIMEIIFSEFVTNQFELGRRLNITPREVQHRLSFLESQFNQYLNIDRLDTENWVMYLTPEGVTNG